MVKIVKFRVRSDGKTYTPEAGNNLIEGLSEEDEAYLVDNGFAEYLDPEKILQTKEEIPTKGKGKKAGK